MAKIHWLPSYGIGVRDVGIGIGPLVSSRLGICGNSVSPFGIGVAADPQFTPGICLAFMGGLMVGTGSAQGTWLQHRTSCRDSEAPISFKN